MNYYNELNQMNKWLDKMILKLKTDAEVSKSNLLIQVTSYFSVSIKSVEKRLKLYETTGMISIKGDLLVKQ